MTIHVFDFDDGFDSVEGSGPHNIGDFIVKWNSIINADKACAHEFIEGPCSAGEVPERDWPIEKKVQFLKDCFGLTDPKET